MTRVMTHNSDSFQSLDIVDVYESRLAAVVTQDPVGVHLMIHRQDVTFGEAELPRGHGDVMAEGFHWAPVWKMHIIDGLVQGVSICFPGDQMSVSKAHVTQSRNKCYQTPKVVRG